MVKNVIVLLADGFEEVEAITPIDYLRRADIDVTVAAAGGNATVTGARGISINADATLQSLIAQGKAVSYDAIIIPGGMPGSANLAASQEVRSLITEMAAAGKWVCAICAAPAVVLAPLGLLSGKQFTCFPGMEKTVRDGTWTSEPVAVAANAAGIPGGIITSRAAGTAGAFAVAIIGQLLGQETGTKVAGAVLL